jgi:hypothetical protein
LARSRYLSTARTSTAATRTRSHCQTGQTHSGWIKASRTICRANETVDRRGGLVDRNGTRIEAERKNETAANSGLIRRQYEVISTADEIVHTSVLPRPNKGQGATGRHHRPSFFRSDSPAASPRILSKGHLPSRAATTPDRRANHLRPVTQETDPVRRGQAGTGETTRPRPTTRSPETAWAWCPA